LPALTSLRAQKITGSMILSVESSRRSIHSLLTGRVQRNCSKLIPGQERETLAFFGCGSISPKTGSVRRYGDDLDGLEDIFKFDHAAEGEVGMGDGLGAAVDGDGRAHGEDLTAAGLAAEPGAEAELVAEHGIVQTLGGPEVADNDFAGGEPP
jgi:hypothetical protein